MEIHIHIHHHDNLSNDIHVKLNRIIENQGVMMAKVDELKAELVEINNTTNEIADDINDLVTKIGEGSLTPAEAEEVKNELLALKARLTGIAAVHTPTTPPTP